MTAKRDHLRKGEDVPLAKSLLAGAGAGLLARTTITPLDTLKLRLQIMYVTNISDRPHNIQSVVRDLLKKEGFAGLWKGNVPGSLMYIVYGGVQFGSYSYHNSLLKNWQLSPQIHSVIVGGLTGVTSSIVSYPFDVLRTRFAVNQSTVMLKLKDSFKNIYKNEGMIGFFHGLTSSIVTISLSNAIMFGSYESIKIFSELNPDTTLERSRLYETSMNLLNSSAGWISGVTSKVITFPLDTIKRRIQLRDSQQLAKFTKHIDVYHSYQGKRFWGIGLQIIEQEGFRSLFRGMSLGLLKTIPNTAVYLWSYEYFVSKLT